MVQGYIKELDTEHTGSYTTATELVNVNEMHLPVTPPRKGFKPIPWKISLSSKLSEFATYDKTFFFNV